MMKAVFIFQILLFSCVCSFSQGLFKNQVLLEIQEEGYHLIVEEGPAIGKVISESSYGPHMVQMSGSLEEILEFFFPEFVFYVSYSNLNSSYDITLRHEGYKRDEALMKKVLTEIGRELNLDIEKKIVIQPFYCLKIEDPTKLKTHHSVVPSKGVYSKKKINFNKMNLEGYTIEKLAESLNEETDYKFWSKYEWSGDQHYDITLNISDHHTIADSLNDAGIHMYGCEKNVPVIFIK